MYLQLSSPMKKLHKIASRVGLSIFLSVLMFLGIFCYWQPPSIALGATPDFQEILVDDNLEDGYWVEAFDVNNDSKPDLVTSGLAVGEVAWYENPGDLTQNSQWTKHPIITLPKPVAVAHQDIDEDGSIDIVISHDYGNCMFNCGPDDGKISWLKNPGDSGLDWTQYHIGDLVATHRLLFGQFTPSEKLELLALPVVGAESWQSAVPVVLYTKPDNLYSATSWPSQVLDDSYYHVIHGVTVGKFDANTNSNLDSVLLASQEGISWFYYGQDGNWYIVPLGTGDLSQTVDPETQNNEHQFTGSGNVDIGKIGTDPYAYIATVEPFHGNKVAIYTKNVESDLVKMRWNRTVIDVFGYPNQNGEGAGHHLKTVDFDGDGNDEFIVAERGPSPFQGVFYYKLLEQEDTHKPSMTFERTQISSSSAARIAIEDFDGDGLLDFATTGYYTPGYFLADNPQVLVFLNRIGK
ncbi:MAG: VCBS repeat-containing protein [Nostocaceae cyanobacterium]|nr:VCBS repeat-containing protein [Nostocaceae cyanobacterium]